jgi:hypothetical protein
MKELIKQLKKRESIIKKAIKLAEQDEGNFPEGRLRVVKTEKGYRYYNVMVKNDTVGDYLSVKNKPLVKELAQKDYNKRFLKEANEELKTLQRIIDKLEDNNGDSTFLKLSPERQRLVIPYILSDDLYAEEWQSVKFKANSYLSENLRYDTKRGEKVRSKSEAIIADILYDLGIPYRYEAPLQLNMGIRYPDFTLLNTKTREEIFLEHLGLMDEDGYRAATFHKLDEYRENGIYLGKNLLITYETEESPLDIKGIKRMLKSLFIS